MMFHLDRADWLGIFSFTLRMLVLVPVGLALAWTLRRVLLWRVRPYLGAHWSELARRAWGLRTLLLCALLGIAVVVFMLALVGYEPAAVAPGWFSGPFAFVTCLLPLMKLRNGFERTIGTLPSDSRPVREAFALILTLAPGTLLLLGLFVFKLGQTSRGFWIGIVLSVFYLLFALSATVHLARALRLLRPARASVVAAVQRASAKMNRPVPEVYELCWSRANAFALLKLNWVMFTTRAAGSLSDAELEAIAAHEIAHLAEPRRVYLLRLLGNLQWLPSAIGILYVTGGNPIGILVSGVGSGVVVYLYQRYSRRLEQGADHSAHATLGEDYATALQALHKLNLTPAVLRGGSHPPLYDRMLAAGYTPTFPRPEPPPRGRLYLLVLLLPCAWFASDAALTVASRLVPRSEAQSDLRFYAASALEGSETAELAIVERWRKRGDRLAAITLLKRTLAGNNSPDRRRTLMQLQLELGDCKAATQTIERVGERFRCAAEALLRQTCAAESLPALPQYCEVDSWEREDVSEP